MRLALAAAAAAVMMAGCATDTDTTDSLILEPCTTEDQETSCYWDASEQGNGIGTDFVVIDGQVFYPER